MRYDVIVIGAGPAGSSAAAILAEKGRSVALLERESFPRYRVGESLIPHCWFPLDRLGLVEAVDAAAYTADKNSVQFASLDGRISTPFYFFQHDDHPSSKTWQVVRSEFDALLRDNAVAKGATLHDRTAARELLYEGERVVGVSASTPDGKTLELFADVTLDASGRDAFAQSRSRWRVPDEGLKKIAIWTYYEGALRDPGLDAGATTIAYLPNKGWFWYLPLAGDKVSVGIVAERDYLFQASRDPAEIFEREIPNQPWIEEHLAPGRQSGEYHVTSDFSYRSRHCSRDGLVLAGDAFAFLDPVFSSGVFFALQSGVLVGDAIDAALASGDTTAGAFADYADRFLPGFEAMRKIVYAFYDPDFHFGRFFKAHPELHRDVTDVLIGNLERDFTDLFRAMEGFAKLPEPLAHGGPLFSTTSDDPRRERYEN